MGNSNKSRSSATSTSSPPDSTLDSSGNQLLPVTINLPSNVDLNDSFFSISITGLRRIIRAGVILKNKRYKANKKTSLAEFVRQLKLPIDVAFVDCLSDDIVNLSREHVGLFLVVPPQSLILDLMDALDLYSIQYGESAATFVWLDVLCFPQRVSIRGNGVARTTSRITNLASSWTGRHTPPHSPPSQSDVMHKSSSGLGVGGNDLITGQRGRQWMNDREFSFAQIAKFNDFGVFMNSYLENESLVKSHFQSQLEITGISECRKLCKVLFTPPMERQFINALMNDFETILYYFVDIDTANARDATSDAGTIKSTVKPEEWAQMNFVYTGAMRSHIRFMVERELKLLKETNKTDLKYLKLGLGHAGMMLDLQVFTPKLEEELLEYLDIAIDLGKKSTSAPSRDDLLSLQATTYEYLGVRLMSNRDGTGGKVVEYFQHALEIREKIMPKTVPTARTKVALGRALTLVGKLDDALSVLTDAIELTRSVRGPSHPELASALSAKATVLFKMEKLTEANTEFEKANQIKKKVRNLMTVYLEDPTFKKDMKRLGGAALQLFDQADEEVSDAAKSAVEKKLLDAEQRGKVGG
jgi:tetratricopeptide (TPR) repeat protein